MVSGVVAGLWILLALGLLVGALGVVNTLTMNVLEQTQELGMLRAIGMPRGQLVRTVLSQAVLIAFLGIAAGAASGLLLAWMINLNLASLFGHSVRLRDARRVRGDSDLRSRTHRSFRRHASRLARRATEPDRSHAIGIASSAPAQIRWAPVQGSCLRGLRWAGRRGEC